MIYLVRHAHAGDKRQWDRPDHLRPLSPSGWREAAGLLTRLGGFAVTAVISSPTTRCVQTVDELAARRRLTLTVDARLGRDAGPGTVRELIAELGDAAGAVLCTHGEVIGAFLTALRREGAPIPDDAEWPKSSTWLLDTVDGAVTAAGYLPPLRIYEAASARH